jgi:hypothetical protein
MTAPGDYDTLRLPADGASPRCNWRVSSGWPEGQHYPIRWPKGQPYSRLV